MVMNRKPSCGVVWYGMVVPPYHTMVVVAIQNNLPSVNTSDYILDFSQNFVLFGDTVDKYKNSLRHVILLKASYYRQ